MYGQQAGSHLQSPLIQLLVLPYGPTHYAGPALHCMRHSLGLGSRLRCLQHLLRLSPMCAGSGMRAGAYGPDELGTPT